MLLVNKGNIMPFVDAMFNDRWINPEHFGVGPSKDIMKLLKKCRVGGEFLKRA